MTYAFNYATGCYETTHSLYTVYTCSINFSSRNRLTPKTISHCTDYTIAKLEKATIPITKTHLHKSLINRLNITTENPFQVIVTSSATLPSRGIL